MITTKKPASYRLTPDDIDRVERLSELLGVSRTQVVSHAIRAFARHHGVLAGEAAGRVRTLIDRYGPDAEVELTVPEDSTKCRVTIAGHATELAAVCWPAPVIETGVWQRGRLEPVPISMWIKDSDPTIKFEVDPQRPNTTVRFPASDLWERWIGIAPEPDANTIRSNAALRAAAGYVQEDEDE